MADRLMDEIDSMLVDYGDARALPDNGTTAFGMRCEIMRRIQAARKPPALHVDGGDAFLLGVLVGVGFAALILVLRLWAAGLLP